MPIKINKLFLFLIFTLSGITISFSQDQLYDTFPLSEGHNWILSFISDLTNRESGVDTHDSGRIEIKIIGSEEFADSIRWDLSETKIYRHQVKHTYDGKPNVDTIIESVNTPKIIEWKINNHKIMFYNFWLLDGYGIYLFNYDYIERYNKIDSLGNVTYKWLDKILTLKYKKGINEITVRRGGTGGSYILNSILYSDNILSVKSIAKKAVLPQVHLNQNYPNPFNPKTIIEFSTSKPVFIKLKIFDLSGRIIETLVSGYYLPGLYSIDWKVNNLSSGIYFYRIEAGDEVQTKKLIYSK